MENRINKKRYTNLYNKGYDAEIKFLLFEYNKIYNNVERL